MSDIVEFIEEPEIGLSEITKERLKEELSFTPVELKHQLTLEERAICELSADGRTPKEVADFLNLPLNFVRKTLKKPSVKESITELVNAQLEMTKEYRMKVINRIVQDKIKQIEEEFEGDFSKATRKDLVDLIALQDSLLKEREKAELGTKDDVYINILNQVVDKD